MQLRFWGWDHQVDKYHLGGGTAKQPVERCGLSSVWGVVPAWLISSPPRQRPWRSDRAGLVTPEADLPSVLRQKELCLTWPETGVLELSRALRRGCREQIKGTFYLKGPDILIYWFPGPEVGNRWAGYSQSVTFLSFSVLCQREPQWGCGDIPHEHLAQLIKYILEKGFQTLSMLMGLLSTYPARLLHCDSLLG